jgi:hypothetical protein
MSEPTDHFRGELFLPGHSHAEGKVQLQFDQRNGTRLTLTIPLLEAMRLLRQLEKVRLDAAFEMPKDQSSD